MPHLVSYIEGLVSGFIFGFVGVLGIIVYLLIWKHRDLAEDEDKSEKLDKSLKKKESSSKGIFSTERVEGEMKQEEIDLIKEAVLYLAGLDNTSSIISENPDTFGFIGSKEKAQRMQEPLPSKYWGGDLDEMETDFNAAIKDLKDKIRNCRSLISFTQELGKAFLSFSKDLNKLSVIAQNNTVKGSINLAQASLFGASEVENDVLSDKIWTALSKCIESTASEYDSLADKMTNGIAYKLSGHGEDLVVAEKHLNGEGSRRLAFVRETIQLREKNLKERDRRREKVNSGNDKTGQSLISGLGLKDITEKLSESEQALSESNTKVANAIKDINKSLPKIIQDSLTFSARSISTSRSSIITVASSVKVICTRTASLMEDFNRNVDNYTFQSIYPKKKLGGSNSPTGGAASAVKRLDDLRDIMFSIVGKMIEAEHGKIVKGTVPGIVVIPPEVGPPSQAPVARAISPNVREKANIFERNDDRPAEDKVLRKLDMSLESACSLAAAPPLKFLNQLPSSFASALQQETSVWFNALCGRVYRDICRSEYFHTWLCSKLAFILNKGNRPGFVDEFKVDNIAFGSTPPIIRNILWAPFDDKHSKRVPPKSPGIPRGEDSYLGPLDDPDYDVACRADLSFKAGTLFSMSTKIKFNWPRDNMASIPIKMKLEVVEVTGPIKFGVRKNCCFVSFLEEPQTRFKVKVEVGEQFKFKDIPLVSDYVETKIRKLIRKRFVYPNAHKTRLLWPRTWWPEGTQNDFMPTGPDAEDPSARYISPPVDARRGNGADESSAKARSTSRGKFSMFRKKGKGKNPLDERAPSPRSNRVSSPSALAGGQPGETENDTPEVKLEKEIGDSNIETEYITKGDEGSPSKDRDTNTSLEDYAELDDTSSDTRVVRGVPQPRRDSKPTIETSITGQTPKAKSPVAANIAQSMAVSKSSAAWFSKLASKTKTKFSEFKEKHLRSGAGEDSNSSSFQNVLDEAVHDDARTPRGSAVEVQDDQESTSSDVSEPNNLNSVTRKIQVAQNPPMSESTKSTSSDRRTPPPKRFSDTSSNASSHTAKRNGSIVSPIAASDNTQQSVPPS